MADKQFAEITQGTNVDDGVVFVVQDPALADAGAPLGKYRKFFASQLAAYFGANITVDTALDANSSNPVSNAAVTAAINLLVPHPTYTTPTASITNATQTVEMGTSLSSVTLNISFTQNDAGAVTGYQLYRNGVEVSTNQNNTQTENNITALLQFYGVVSFGIGPVKQNILGVDDPTGQIVAGSVNTPTRTITPKLKAFFGVGSSVPADYNDGRALPQNAYADSSTLSLTTGTTATKFYVVLPVDRVIAQVNDVGNLNADITATYVQINDSFTMQDAGGNTYAARMYERTQATPFSTSTTHLITLGNA